jgi:hypothetical protein
VVVGVGEHSFFDVTRESLVRFLNEIVCSAKKIDQSVLKPTGILDVQYLLDGKILRKQVDKVLKAIDSVGDPIERADACRGVQHIVMASIQIGIGFAATPAKTEDP